MHSESGMPKKWQFIFIKHSKTSEYKKHLSETEQNIAKILSDNKYKPVIEYSGGKDSLVLLKLVMAQDPTIPVWNFHPGYSEYFKRLHRSQETHEEVMKSAYQTGTQDITVDNTPYTKKDSEILEYFPLLFNFMKKRKLNLELLGHRKDESLARKKRLAGNLIKKEGSRRVCFLLRDWTWKDIWAYIITNDLYYISHYDTYGVIDGYDKARFTSHFNKNELKLGGTYYFDKITHPYSMNDTCNKDEEWDKGL
jgi:3'-phosphoadenosine 5'-phosphosulfate sulfotransferase (PAPS reductase)/FAD synthetase